MEIAVFAHSIFTKTTWVSTKSLNMDSLQHNILEGMTCFQIEFLVCMFQGGLWKKINNSQGDHSFSPWFPRGGGMDKENGKTSGVPLEVFSVHSLTCIAEQPSKFHLLTLATTS